jgi:hypothetical protein
MCFTPPLAYYQRGVVDTQLVIADSSYHLRVFNPDNSVTSGTLRSPTCSDPLAQMVMFRGADSDHTFVAFRCARLAACIQQRAPASVADAPCADPSSRLLASCCGRQTATRRPWWPCSRTRASW